MSPYSTLPLSMTSARHHRAAPPPSVDNDYDYRRQTSLKSSATPAYQRLPPPPPPAGMPSATLRSVSTPTPPGVVSGLAGGCSPSLQVGNGGIR
jgi:hypothetical protein